MDKYCEYKSCKSLEEAKAKKWKVVKANSLDSCTPEDDAIFTEDNKELLCTSEWLRFTDGILDYIVDLHNQEIAKKCNHLL